MKKSNENIIPTEVLHRPRELEYIRYIEEQGAESKDHMLRQMISSMMLGNWIETLVLTNTYPDDQVAYLSITEWNKNRDDNNQENKVIFFIISKFEGFYVEMFSTLLYFEFIIEIL